MMNEIVRHSSRYKIAERKSLDRQPFLVGLNGGLPYRDMFIELGRGEVVIWDTCGEVRTVLERRP